VDKPQDRLVQEDNCCPDYGEVPEDFPRTELLGAVGGAQPKLLLARYEGRLYAPGCTPPEVYTRWAHCEDLANHLAAKAVESKQGKRSHMAEVEILEQYLPRLIATRWTSEPEARFIIRRVAQILDWPVPTAAQS
jgi:hypothetical protein